MSFGDLEKGYGGYSSASSSAAQPYALSGGRDGDQEYIGLVDRVTQQIQQIANNTAQVTKIVAMLGTPKDTQDLRDQLHDISESTKELMKEAQKDVKVLGKLDGGVPSENSQRRRQQQTLIQKLKQEVDRFLTVQKQAQQKEREYVAQARKAQTSKQHDAAFGGSDYDADETQKLLHDEQQRQKMQVIDNELDYNDELINEREQDIEDIASNIKVVNDIFNDLRVLVNEQQETLDTIENNVQNTVVSTQGAKAEIKVANDYQKSARNKMCCILMIFVIISAIIVTVVVLKVV